MQSLRVLANPTGAVPPGHHARQSIRYPLNAKAVFSWVDRAGVAREETAVTRDVSVRGAYLFTSACPACGSLLTVDVFLSPQPSSWCGTRLRLQGRAVRVDNAPRQGQGAGFAIQNKRAALCDV